MPSRIEQKDADEFKQAGREAKFAGKRAKNAAEDVAEDAGRSASDQALQAVDVAFGAYAAVAGAVTKTVDQWRNPETREQEIESLRTQLNSGLETAERRGGDLRRQVTEETRKRVEPVRVRVEPAVNRVRELV